MTVNREAENGADTWAETQRELLNRYNPLARKFRSCAAMPVYVTIIDGEEQVIPIPSIGEHIVRESDDYKDLPPKDQGTINKGSRLAYALSTSDFDSYTKMHLQLNGKFPMFLNILFPEK